MSAVISREKVNLVGITVKLTPQEHQALRLVVFAEGHSSFQNYLRSIVVQKIRESRGKRPAIGPDAA